jgi:hypothetical protein
MKPETPELLRSLIVAHGRAAIDRVAETFGMSNSGRLPKDQLSWP